MQKIKTKKFKKLEIKTKKILSGDFFGNYKTLFKGSGIDFAEIREYVFGDSIKRIDWKTTAKHGKMFVKNYEQERDLKIIFFLDISESMQFSSEEKTKIDLLQEIFYLFALSGIKSGDNIGAIIFDGFSEKFINYEKTESVIVKILNELDKNIEKNKKIKNNNYVDFIKKYKIKDSLIFILSDKMDFDKKIFRTMSINNELNYINIFDFFENNLTEEKLNISFGNKNTFMDFCFGNNKKVVEYKKLRKNKIEKFERNLKKNNVNYFSIDTKDDLLRKIVKSY